MKIFVNECELALTELSLMRLIEVGINETMRTSVNANDKVFVTRMTLHGVDHDLAATLRVIQQMHRPSE